MTSGLKSACMRCLALRHPRPMPTFFIAPPKPVASWPFTCVIATIASAATATEPMRTDSKCLNPSIATSQESPPLRPSAMMIGASTVA